VCTPGGHSVIAAIKRCAAGRRAQALGAEGSRSRPTKPAAHAAIEYALARDESMRILRDEVLQACGGVARDPRRRFAGGVRRQARRRPAADAGAVRSGAYRAHGIPLSELPMPTSASSAAMSCAPSSATRGEDAESSPFRLSHRATVLYSCSRSCGGMARLKVVRTVRDRMGQPGRRAVGALARFTR